MSKVGIAFRSSMSSAIVSSIAEDGLLANTNIKPGMKVLTINGIAIRGPSEGVAVLRVCLPGEITILAGSSEYVTATVVKPNIASKVGVIVKKDRDGDNVFTRFAPKSPFRKTDLKEGMKIVTVNGVDCTRLDATDIVGILGKSDGYITVLAKVARKEKS